jgi:hypothetical protein
MEGPQAGQGIKTLADAFAALAELQAAVRDLQGRVAALESQPEQNPSDLASRDQ